MGKDWASKIFADRFVYELRSTNALATKPGKTLGDWLGESLVLGEILGLSVQGSQSLNKKPITFETLGSLLGIAVGSRLGLTLGFDGGIELATIGAVLGASVVLVVGDELVLIVGFWVGSVDGDNEMLGSTAGCLDGFWLGCAVGLMVGDIVGSVVTISVDGISLGACDGPKGQGLGEGLQVQIVGVGLGSGVGAS